MLRDKPAGDLEKMVLEAVPLACERCRGVLRTLARSAPTEPTAEDLARQLRFPNRYVLARTLARHHFPPLQELKDWIRLLAWLALWEQRGRPLHRQAWDHDTEPSVYYRTVRRVTGSTWSKVRGKGLEYWVGQFSAKVGRLCRCPDEELAAGRG